MKKGIILAGGHGTRLYPLTETTSKQLLPVFDKPMIYYPLTTLMLGGVRQIAIISTPKDLVNYRSLLGSGEKWGIELVYYEQKEPKGLAEAFLICEEFIGSDSISLILGDNIFYGNIRYKEIFTNFKAGALIFGYPVSDPERYGIVEFDSDGNVLSIEEKPKKPKSRFAVPGLYLYDNKVIEYAKNLSPSRRGELEITDLNLVYLRDKSLSVETMGRGVAWLDTGTIDSLNAASSFIMSVENQQSFKIGCPEEVSLRMGLIDIEQFEYLVSSVPKCDYKSYLLQILEEENRSK